MTPQPTHCPWRVLQIAAIFSGGFAGTVTAQTGMAPMVGMETESAATRDPDMNNMMGAPLPFGIMIGRAETWMVGYQLMFEKMDGNLVGSRSVSDASVLDRFETRPTDMTMQNHMAMLMYAPTDKLTLMAMLPFVRISMGELHRDGSHTIEQSKGIGDLELRGLYSLYAAQKFRHRFLVNFGVGVPTGSDNQLDSEGARTEYPMQTGSGTYSLLPGFTYLGQVLPWSWGAEFNSMVRLGKNEHGYRLGNRYEPRIWIARKLSRSVSVSTGAGGEFWETVHGSDALLDPTDEPAKDAALQGGKRLSVSLGITLHPASGFFKGQQFLIQGDLPVLQSLDGPQLKRSYMLHVAWQRGF